MKDGAMKFNFRVSFKISGSYIDVEEDKVRLFEGKEIFLMSSIGSESISKSRYLVVQGEGFESYRDASIEMLKIDQALKIAALKQHIGISTSNRGHDDYPINVILREMERGNLSKGIIFRQLVSRRAYPAHMVLWDPALSKDVDPISFTGLSEGVARFYHEYQEAFSLSQAIDTLNAIHFEYSSMVRLILSMTVIEMLVGTGLSRTDEQKAVIDELIDMIQKSPLDKDQKESLSLAVNGCKNLSIGSSCRRVIKSKLGKEAAHKFNSLYDYRSRLVHSGEIKSPLMSDEEREAEIYKAAGEAYVLASELVDVMLEEYKGNEPTQ